MAPFLPFIGSLHLMDIKNSALSLRNRMAKYGHNGIMAYMLPGNLYMVMISSPEYLSLLFEKYGVRLIARESINWSYTQFTGGANDILLSEGEYWRLARKAFVKRSYGVN
jgi:hypothetical protein